ncbi:DUF2298 domain-containing protein [Halorhabdus sp. BNX81]|uniref:DUF2298 domain-containing protein n=1 Tax=Halorhabdus sp. BNX81 TaxID=2980181 RepID=UPI0023DD3074|nr:DUF2298 domain-containing protein [Halorhabdus sp. BNX81]WEL21835.1 DUF2298 domain-containing protein [Halorhabdus sp. BNX81]
MEFGLLALWLGTYLLLLFVGLPITHTVLPDLADSGAGVAIPLTLTIIWLVTFFVGHVSLTLGLWGGLFVLGLVAVIARHRSDSVNRTVYMETATVFSIAFLFVVAIRAVDPAVHASGGEKFLDFGLLQTLLRAEALPPEDMWFAGEPVQYYYSGHLLASLLARMTDTAARFAYNLSVAGFYAMVVTAAYGLAKDVAAGRDLPARPAGVIAAFFVGLASNLVPAVQLVLLTLPTDIATRFSVAVGHELDGLGTGFANFSYWTASRVIPGTINEFPLFAWLNGDLHPHMMSPPLLLLAATLLYGYYRTPAGDRTRRIALLAALGPLAAQLAVSNTWSFPSIGGLTVLTVSLAPASPVTLLPPSIRNRLDARDWRWEEIRRHVLAGVAGVAVLVIGGALSLPFWLQSVSGQQHLALLPERSGFGPLLLVHGAFLIAFACYYVRYLHSHTTRVVRRTLLGGAFGLVLVSVLLDVPALGLFGPLIAVGWFLRRVGDYKDVPTPGYETILIVAGAGLVVLVEFVYVQEQAGPGRMNTVFKFYAQTWALWASAVGVVLVGLLADRRPSLGLSSDGWRRGFRVLVAVLVVSTSIYGVLALSQHFSGSSVTAPPEEPTLDALAFVDRYHPEEAPAIHWLNDNVTGQPNLLSRPTSGSLSRYCAADSELSTGVTPWRWDIYNWGNAPATMTGVPTVAGWNREIGYRGASTYCERVHDTIQLFTGAPTNQRRLLAQYDIAYVYVGPLERAAFPEITVQKLDAVTIEKHWDSVTIYRVNQSMLGSNYLRPTRRQ